MAELDGFAQQLMRFVRDRAMVAADQLLSGRIVGSQGDRWRRLASGNVTRSALEVLLPDVVDQVIFELLNAAENGELPLAWRDATGRLVPLEELGRGELAGWLMGSDGWRYRFSGQRFNDYLASLRLEADWEGPDKPSQMVD